MKRVIYREENYHAAIDFEGVFLTKKMFLIYLILPIYGAFQNSIEPFQMAYVCFAICLLMISISLSNEEKNSTEKY